MKHLDRSGHHRPIGNQKQKSSGQCSVRRLHTSSSSSTWLLRCKEVRSWAKNSTTSCRLHPKGAFEIYMTGKNQPTFNRLLRRSQAAQVAPGPHHPGSRGESLSNFPNVEILVGSHDAYNFRIQILKNLHFFPLWKCAVFQKVQQAVSNNFLVIIIRDSRVTPLLSIFLHT